MMSNDVVFILGLLIGLLIGSITGAFIISALCVSKNSELQDRIDKALEILKLCNSKCSKEVIDIFKGVDKE